MKISTIEYLGGLRTQSVHHRSGDKVITDAPPDNNGKGEAFSPTDLLANSLGCCMITIMGMVADRHAIDLTGTKIDITKIMVANPRRVAEIVVEFQMPKLDLAVKDRQLLENAAHTCPVALSLHPDLKQTVIFNW
jgi:putative redox protein